MLAPGGPTLLKPITGSLLLVFYDLNEVLEELSTILTVLNLGVILNSEKRTRKTRHGLDLA